MTKYSPDKTGEFPRIFPNFQNCARCEKDLKNNKHNSLICNSDCLGSGFPQRVFLLFLLFLLLFFLLFSALRLEQITVLSFPIVTLILSRRKTSFRSLDSLRSSLFRFLLAGESDSQGDVSRRRGARAKSYLGRVSRATPNGKDCYAGYSLDCDVNIRSHCTCAQPRFGSYFPSFSNPIKYFLLACLNNNSGNNSGNNSASSGHFFNLTWTPLILFFP